MKLLIFILAYICYAKSMTTLRPDPISTGKYVFDKDCARGPVYWCQNLTAAADCRATKHCIQTVWIHQELPPDTTSICQTCLEMVKEARDQLESNETQELIKQVFEGSCALIHLKPIVKECDKIADNYIPDLIDTLASQMNPQIVCSVAGLCNSEKVHKLLEAAGEEPKPKIDQCDGCHEVVGILRKKFDGMSRDDVLQMFLMQCRSLGSFSDACTNIVITYFEFVCKTSKRFRARGLLSHGW